MFALGFALLLLPLLGFAGVDQPYQDTDDRASLDWRSGLFALALLGWMSGRPKVCFAVVGLVVLAAVAGLVGPLFALVVGGGLLVAVSAVG